MKKSVTVPVVKKKSAPKKVSFDPVYKPEKIESVLQKEWEKKKVYKTEYAKKTKKKPFYVLSMIPYPSGSGLHIGHPRSYTATDIIARKKRMEGFNVLNPMGYDAFGLPAEQYAIQNKVHPKKAVALNVATFERQLKKLGFSFDWDRKINTTDPEYYRWTQWIFLKLYNSYYNTNKKKALPIEDLVAIFEKGGNINAPAFTTGQIHVFEKKEWLAMSALEKQEVLMKYRLAYEGVAEVNWCEGLGTVLANDEVVDGKDGPVSERGGYPVIKKDIRQWFLRITAYADRLLSGLDTIDWPHHVKEIERNWIGKSEGAEIEFAFEEPFLSANASVTVFTTRPDTLFGVTFLAISAELAQTWVQNGWNASGEILAYIQHTIQEHQKNDFNFENNKTGISTNIYVIHPGTKEKIPVWIANYVLPGYGTGVVMGVPAHDERDFDFAKQYSLPIVSVIAQEEDVLPFVGEGTVKNSKAFDGLSSQEAKIKITESVKGKLVTRYKMRDAIFARQRYWGEPVPLYKDKSGIIHEVKKLPLTLPNTTSYEPTGTGEGPLANISAWKKAGYETNTMPGWAGSSWYYLRYMDVTNKKAIADKKEVAYWKQVNMYLGGAEHATGHLLYARFWHKFMKDYGFVPTEEPFKQFVAHGMILASDGRKMSKRWGNVVNPDDVVATYGADTTRLYIAFMGPYTESIPWSTDSMVGCRRFIERVYKKVGSVIESNVQKTDKEALRAIHKLIQKVTEDIETCSFNTSVAKAMETMNTVENLSVSKQDMSLFTQVLSPFITHVTEYVWRLLGNTTSIHTAPWPKVNKKVLIEQEVTLGVQILGKLRATITVPFNAEESVAVALARQEQNIQKWLENKEVVKVIYVKNRILNLIIADKKA